MFDGIDADTVNRIVLDKAADPGIPGVYDVLVLCVDINEREVLVTKPALFNGGLVVCIIGILDETELMEIRLLVERFEACKVRRVGSSSHMVYNYVDHEIHVALVQRI